MKRNSAFRYQMLVTLAAACATIVGVHQLPASEDGRATSQAEVANAPSDSSGERYEGYLFLDVDGQPMFLTGRIYRGRGFQIENPGGCDPAKEDFARC